MSSLVIVAVVAVVVLVAVETIGLAAGVLLAVAAVCLLQVTRPLRFALAGNYFLVGVLASAFAQLVMYRLDAAASSFSWPLVYAGFAVVTMGGLIASNVSSPSRQVPLRSLALGVPVGVPVGFLVLMAWAVLTGGVS